MTDAPKDDALQFDKAEFDGAQAAPASGPGGPTCTFCGRPLQTYWAIGDKLACGSCHAQVQFMLASGSPAGRFARATVFGLGAALLGAGAWYAIARLTGYELALIAIAIGWGVGVAVRHGSENRGGWPYQLLAVLLTYLSIAGAYVPMIAQGVQYTLDHEVPQGAQVTPQMVADVVPSALAYAIAVPFSLAAPFFGGILSVLIVGFGLYQAFTMTRKLVIPISGPHEVGSSAPPSPAPPTGGGQAPVA